MLSSLVVFAAFATTNPNVYLAPSQLCSPYSLEMTSSSYPPGGQIQASGSLFQTNNGCGSGSPVYYWIENSAGVIIYQGSTVAGTSTGSLVSFSITSYSTNWQSSAAGSYEIFAGTCTQPNEANCPSVLGGKNSAISAPFSLSSSAQNYQVTITMLSNSVGVSGVTVNVYNSNNAEVGTENTGSSGQTPSYALAPGSYTAYWFPTAGSYSNGQQSFTVSQSQNFNFNLASVTTATSSTSTTSGTSTTTTSNTSPMCPATTTVVTENTTTTTLKLPSPLNQYPLCEAPKVAFNEENVAISAALFVMGLIFVGIGALIKK